MTEVHETKLETIGRTTALSIINNFINANKGRADFTIEEKLYFDHDVIKPLYNAMKDKQATIANSRCAEYRIEIKLNNIPFLFTSLGLILVESFIKEVQQINGEKIEPWMFCEPNGLDHTWTLLIQDFITMGFLWQQNFLVKQNAANKSEVQQHVPSLSDINMFNTPKAEA